MPDNLTPTFFTVDHFDDFNEIIFLGGGPEPVVVVASLSPVGGKIREKVFDFESSEVEDDGAEIVEGKLSFAEREFFNPELELFKLEPAEVCSGELSAKGAC